MLLINYLLKQNLYHVLIWSEMKPRKISDLKELNDMELAQSLKEAEETILKQKFQHALSQLHDTAYLKILRKDIARIKTLINERQRVK